MTKASRLRFLLLFLAVSVASAQIDLESRFQGALDLLSLGQYDEALAAFDGLADQLNGSSAQDRYLRATALTNAALALHNKQTDSAGVLHRLEASLTICESQLKGSNDSRLQGALLKLSGIDWVLIGQEDELLGKMFHAIEASEKAIHYLPGSEHRWLGQAYALEGGIASQGAQWKEGNVLLEKALVEDEALGDAEELLKTLDMIMLQHSDKSRRVSAAQRTGA